ncbi:retrovirus-related pol polyprotein from transposon TNT 1-94 [Tanacetum coccineum]
MLLAQALEAGVILDEEQLAFFTDTRHRVDSGADTHTLPTTAIFQTDDLDAFDSDCDEAPSASAVLMAKLSAYDSDVLSEVPNYNTYQDNNLINQSFQEMQYYEQPIFVDDSNIDITSGSNIISYDQYINENESEVVQDTTSSEQQDSMIMSVIEEMSNQVAKCNAANQENKTNLSTTVEVLKRETKEKQDKYIDEIVDLEKKKKSLKNIVYKQGQTVQMMHMLTKPQVLYDENHKTALGYQNPLYLTQAQRKKPVLYCGHTLVKKQDALSVFDSEETLDLAEATRLKMNKKQNDPIVKEKRVNIKPIDYSSLNELNKHFVPQKQISAEQAFWLPISKIVSEQTPVQPKLVQNDLPRQLPTTRVVKQNLLKAKNKKYVETEKKELLIENERLLEQIISQDIVCTTMHSYDDLVKYEEMKQSYIDEYSRCVQLEAELSKQKDMVEKAIYNELSNRCSRLENDAPEFPAFFEINDLKAQLQAKNTSISKLKEHIATLKGKSVSDCTVLINNSNVIALGMFKFDFPSLSPKLRKNKEVHVNYLKQEKEHADTLHEVVKQARALKPLDNALDYACKFTTQIQELLAYVSATCPSSRIESEKLVVVTPINKNMKVRAKSSKSNKKNEWKPTGKVFTKVGHTWLPTGRTFTINGTKCPLTRITSTKVVPPRKPVQTKVIKKTSPSSVSQGKPNETKLVSFGDYSVLLLILISSDLLAGVNVFFVMGINNRFSYNTKEDQTYKISKSVFIMNFPDHFTAPNLWNVCLTYGNVIDVHIPFKKSKAGFKGNLNLMLHNLMLLNPKNNASKGVVKNSFAAVLKSSNTNPNSAIDSSPAIVLDDSCITDRDLSFFLMGKIKDINAMSNLYFILANEGFENVNLSYLGDMWVLMEMDSIKSKEKISKHVGVGSWFYEIKPACNSFVTDERIVWISVEGFPIKAYTRNTFVKIVSPWGKLSEVEVDDNLLLPYKKLCVITRPNVIINDKIKVIVKEHVYWIHVKELDAWTPEFSNDLNDNSSSDWEFDNDEVEITSRKKGVIVNLLKT